MKLKKIFIYIIIAILAVSYLYKDSPLGEDIMEVTFLDVGQGDCSVIRLPDTNEVILIDSGEADNLSKVTSFLDKKGIDTIDYLIATHPHSDHIGSMAEIVNRFNVLNVYMPKAYHNTTIYERLLTAVKNKNLKVTSAKAGVTLPIQNINAVFAAPCGNDYEELNDYSAVLKIEYNDTGFLFTGDAEKASENEMLNGEVSLYADVLKVGHHGSDTSSSKRFLNEVKPQYAVISADGESYGHPHQTTLDRLWNCNPYIEILTTYENGNITFLTDGVTIEVQTDR